MKRCSCGRIIKRKYWKKCGECRAIDRDNKKEHRKLKTGFTDVLKKRRKKEFPDIFL